MTDPPRRIYGPAMLPSFAVRAAAFLLTALVCALLPAAAHADIDVKLTSTGFQPSKLTVDAGETLHFVNTTGKTWSVTSDGGLFDSGALDPQASYTMTMSVPGRHTYKSAGGAVAQATLTVLSRTLPGPGTDEAAAQIPPIPFPGVEADDVDEHPDFGVKASRTRIMLGFKPGATVTEANEALEDAEVRIIGGLPTLGTLLVQTESAGWGGSWWNLEQTLAKLRAAKAVQYASMSTAVEPLAVPRRAESAIEDEVVDWDWNYPTVSGAWALTAASFPEAWNLRESLVRKKPSIITGIVDAGFEPHEDLPGLEIQSVLCPGGGDCRTIPNSPDPHGHGNHVAGIIGAAFDNDSAERGRSKGVPGANPVARMFGYSAKGFRDYDPGGVGLSTLNDKNLELFDLILRSRPASLRVINYSMGASAFDGADWQSEFGNKLCGPGSRDDDLPDQSAPIKEPCTPNNQDDWQREMAAVGMAAAPVARAAAQAGVMIVQAAGNDGKTFCQNGVCAKIDTASRNEFSWVSRHWGEPVVNPNSLPNPILTVQASTAEGGPRDDTTFGADVAAPGDGILSTVLDDEYGVLGGSSMAAPQVTALVGMLLADDPSLTLTQVRRRVLDWAGARPSQGQIDFKWSMPEKMNRDVNADGVVDYPRSKVLIAPTNYQVDLDACDASANGKVPATFTWKVDGQEVGSTSDCVFRWRPAAEGTYSVELTVTGAAGESQSVTKSVKVEDLLVISVGDSIASGEGNPDIVSPYSVWQEARCHRTAFGGPAQAARLLEAADVKSAVTFVHLACSGARMIGDLDANNNPQAGDLGIGGLLTPYEGVVPDNDDCVNTGRISWDYCEPPQLERAKALAGDRIPDALTVSIGANDMRFSTILTYCMKPFNDCSLDEQGRGLFEERIKLLEGRYAAVAAKIKALWPTMDPSRVFITQYPDPTTTETGEVTLDCGVSSGITEHEAAWAHTTVVPALNKKVAEAAAKHGWTLADGIPEAFTGHGYCSDDRWVMDIRDTFWEQGDKNGGYHPNYEGHSAYAKEMVRVIKDRLNISGGESSRLIKDRAPRINAFRSLAAGGGAARFADFNDASKDGIRRIERSVDDFGAFSETPDTKFGTDPKERTAPDGRVGMRDLRRYRDAWLKRCVDDVLFGCPPQADIKLDGAADHPKKDSNLDGCVFGATENCGAREHFFARADLNGDRVVDPEHKGLVPWKADGTKADDRAGGTLMTDADVLKAAWTGDSSAEGWDKSKVPMLLRSGDVQVHADAVLDTGAAKATVQVRLKGGENVGAPRTIKRTDQFAVLTVPIISASQEFELVTTAETARGRMSSVSEPFTLKYGEDKAMAACPDVSLDAAPARVAADGVSTSIVTATLHKCAGRTDVAGKAVTFTLDSTEGGASVTTITATTDAAGRAQARFTSGTAARDYTVTAAVAAVEDAEPLEADVEISTVPKLEIRYVWKQTIDKWEETGSTKWGAFDPVMPDCTRPGMEYCIDTWQLGLRSQTNGGIERRGTLTGAGDRFQLTEKVTESQASSQASWTLSFPDGETEDGGKIANWSVTDPQAYTNHTVSGVASQDEAGAVTINGLQNVGDLPYHYALFGSPTGGTIDPIEGHVATSQYLLVPKPQPILFGAAPEKSISFARDEDGFKPFTSCGVLDEDLTTQKGYFVPGDGNAYIPGTSTVGRKPTYSLGDRPMPVGPGRLKISYRFAAVASYAGQPAPTPELPDCEEDNPPVADFEPETADDRPAREGRTVTFHDFSTDPDNDIVKYAWNFGDGKTGSGSTAYHLFADDGTFQVELTVTDAKGKTDTITKEIEVANEPPEADVEDATAKVGEPLRVELSMLDPGKTDNGHLDWKLSSSNPAWPTITGNDKGGLYWHEFTNVPAGTYPLTLEVTDDDGQKTTDDAVAIVLDDPPPPPPPPPLPTYATCDPTVSLDAEERNFLDLINEYRAENGLGPVKVSATLTRAAERHANDMAAKDYMGHTGSDGSTPAERAWGAKYPRSAGVGENLAESETAVQSLAAWRSSATGHNENMLNPAWKAIGIARAKGRIWRTANSFGTVLDCAATDAERLPPAGKLTGDPTPSGDAGMQSTGTTEVQDAEPEAAPEARAAGAPAPAALVPTAEAEIVASKAAAGPTKYAPTIAVARTPKVPRAGRPMTVVNRSRDAAGTPIAATVDYKDATPIQSLAAGATGEHVYKDSTATLRYGFEMTGKDAANRDATLLHDQTVAAVLPPQVYFLWDTAPAVAGRPYKVAAAAYDTDQQELIPGLEITFSVGTTTVKATTGADGAARAELVLPDVGGEQKIHAVFAGTPDFKPASAETTINVQVNHAPVADAGGPYVIGEGAELLLNGTASSNPDPEHFDKIVKWEWDLDGNGVFDDASGRLPERLSGETVTELVCGGDCAAGTAYPIALKVTDSWAKSHVDSTTLKTVADFDLMLGNEVITVVPGESSHVGVKVIGSKSYTKPVTLSMPDLPTGVTASFSKNPVTPTDVSVLTLTGGSQLKQGTLPIKLRGTDGELTKEISDQVKVAFGLVPVCYGTMTGRVVNKTTGAPMEGIRVTQGAWNGDGPVYTDASGRYHFSKVPLGTNNAAITAYVTATKDGFWEDQESTQVSCGALAELPDVQLLDKRKGKVTTTVTDLATGKPLGGAKVRDTYSQHVFGTTGLDGKSTFDLDLTTNNAERGQNLTAELGGYWGETKFVVAKENVPATASFELMKKCQGTIAGGKVLDIDTKLPVADTAVGLYITNYSFADYIVKTDSEGNFTFDRNVDLGHQNKPTSYKVKPEPPSGAPQGSYGIEKYFPVSACGAVVSDTVYVKVPKPGYGTITGTVTDEDTNTPMTEDTWVQLCELTCRSVKTDGEGKFSFGNVFTGFDGASSFRSVTVSAPDYYVGSAGAVLAAGQTKDLPVKMLKRKYGALSVEVVDSVTKAPVPGASVSDSSNYCGGGDICLYTDREGKKSKSGIELGDRNAPRGFNLLASASGYWPQYKGATIKAGETAQVKYELQRECEPARIRGTVVNASTGGPIEGASISGGSVWPMYTDAKGEFEIHPVRPGTGNNPRQIWLTAAAEDFYSQSKMVTIFCGAQITVDFGSATSKTGTLVGKVTDKATGAPIKDAFIGTDFGATAKSGTDGTYKIVNVPLATDNQPRDWAVHVTPAGYKSQTKTANVKADVDTPLDFEFSAENATPVADPAQVTATEDTAKAIKVTGSDADAGDTLSYHYMSYPQHGSVSGTLPNVTYTPDKDYNGTDSFEFIANDGAASSAKAKVEIVVAPVNDAPEAIDDQLEATPDATTRIPVSAVLGNDKDVDGDALQLSKVEPWNGATVTLDGDEIVFTPPAGHTSQYHQLFFAYTATDGKLTDTGMAFVKVQHGPKAPVCPPRTLTTIKGQALTGQLECTDANGDALTYAAVDAPAQGTLDVAAGGAFTYTPTAGYTGEVMFTYKATDEGGLAAPKATVTVKVVESNVLPACENITASTTEDAAVDLVHKCTDADGDTLTLEAVSQPGHGALAGMKYTPQENWSGEDTFTFRANDGVGPSQAATATITVTAVDDAPACPAGTASTDEDVAVSIPLSCTDVEGDALTLSVAGDVPHGTVVPDGPGKLKFTPAANWSGTSTFAYKATGGGASSPAADVTVTVNAVNDLPSCGDLALASDGGPAEVTPSCSDVEADGLTYEITAQGEKGTASVVDGKLRYVPEAGAAGTDEFRYVARDGGAPGGRAAGDDARVAVTITPKVEPEPTATPTPVPTATPTPTATATPTATPTVTPPLDKPVTEDLPEVSEVLLGCARRKLILEDVIPAGPKVKLLGWTLPSNAGREVEIRSLVDGEVVARPKVDATGRFTAIVKAPPKRRNREARYDASLEREISPALKLWRRLRVDSAMTVGDRAEIRGRVTGPLAKRAADRVIEVRRQESCKPGKVIAKIKPRRDGRFRVSLPSAAAGAVYRLQTRVRNASDGRTLERTYSLPRVMEP